MLSGSSVVLQPLELFHRELLIAAASDGELWTMTVTIVPGRETIDAYIEQAIAGRNNGTMQPFAIIDQNSGRVVGSTRYWKIDKANRKLEIGHTWFAASAQRTSINTEAKYRLLSHAFEALGCVRVEFMADELNARSRAAILRLGAVEEGILRNERIMPDGRKRNSVLFSIIDSEWPAVKGRLQDKLAMA